MTSCSVAVCCTRTTAVLIRCISSACFPQLNETSCCTLLFRVHSVKCMDLEQWMMFWASALQNIR